MTRSAPKLLLICGKAASGKSSLAERLVEEEAAVLLSEDVWLAKLFGEEMSTLRDYVRFSARLEAVVGPHVVALLRRGLSVVLDFQANTPTRRAWMRALIDEAGVDHELHFLDVPDDLCKARLRARNADGSHPFALTEAEFDQIAPYFVPPAPEEGFIVVRHGPEGADPAA